MAHVEIARWVGKHIEYILFRALVIGAAGAKGGELIPYREPLLLGALDVINIPGIPGIPGISGFLLLHGDKGTGSPSAT